MVTIASLCPSAVLVATALVIAIAAAAPRIGSRADELADALAEQDLPPELSRQLVTLSRIA